MPAAGRSGPDGLTWHELAGVRVRHIRDNVLSPTHDFVIVLQTALVLATEGISHSIFKTASRRWVGNRPLLNLCHPSHDPSTITSQFVASALTGSHGFVPLLLGTKVQIGLRGGSGSPAGTFWVSVPWVGWLEPRVGQIATRANCLEARASVIIRVAPRGGIFWPWTERWS